MSGVYLRDCEHGVAVYSAKGLRYSGEYCAAGQDWQRALYLRLALGGFDLGAAGFAGATAGYVAAPEQAWQQLW